MISTFTMLVAVWFFKARQPFPGRPARAGSVNCAGLLPPNFLEENLLHCMRYSGGAGRSAWIVGVKHLP